MDDDSRGPAGADQEDEGGDFEFGEGDFVELTAEDLADLDEAPEDGPDDPGRVDLYGFDGLSVWAIQREDGALAVHGLDLNAGAAFGDGVSQYEWVQTVALTDVPLVLEALGEPAGTPLLEAIERGKAMIAARGFSDFLEEHGIEASFWSSLS